MMDNHTLTLLEYESLLKFLAGYAQSGPGADLCMRLRPDLNVEEIETSWAQVSEALKVIRMAGKPPLRDFYDIDELIDQIEIEGAVLNPVELLLINSAVRTCRLVKNYIRTIDNSADLFPLLSELTERLPILSDLERAIDRSINAEGEILDSASPELAKIRRELGGMRSAIHNKMNKLMRLKETESSLQDPIITQRGGRYVIPVKASSTGAVPGLVHDYSSSGATAYVEPLEMVQENNTLNLLKRKEKREVKRILTNLTQMASGVAGMLAPAVDLLAFLDSLFAKAAMSRTLNAVAPLNSDKEGFELINARHPLLVLRKGAYDGNQSVVPVDVRLSPGKQMLVISGVNAGGKTVALKTAGLLCLMAQSGLLLPVDERSSIRFFDNIFASIGDEQDLESNLSTFSGHIRRLSGMLEKTTEGTLVLLDELGTGTDPAEGAALALAVLNELKDRNAWVLTATHYQLLKGWAQLTDDVESAAVRTDSSGRPIFGIDYGTPGFSSGLAMARELGMAEDIVAKAESYLDEGQKKTMELMARLESERAGLLEARLKCQALEEELSRALSFHNRKEKERAIDYNREVESLKSQVNKALSQAEREIKAIKKKAKSPIQEVTAEFQKVKKELKKYIPAAARTYEPLESVSYGQKVFVESLGKKGTVVACHSSKGVIEIDLEGIKVKTSLDDLTRPEKSKEPRRKEKEYYIPAVSAAPRELNLIGKRVEDALPLIDKSLDQATLGGVKTFCIIHGIGTGRLRQAVRGYLKEDIRVKEFQTGQRNIGGEGVTLVTLSD